MALGRGVGGRWVWVVRGVGGRWVWVVRGVVPPGEPGGWAGEGSAGGKPPLRSGGCAVWVVWASPGLRAREP